MNTHIDYQKLPPAIHQAFEMFRRKDKLMALSCHCIKSFTERTKWHK